MCANRCISFSPDSTALPPCQTGTCFSTSFGGIRPQGRQSNSASLCSAMLSDRAVALKRAFGSAIGSTDKLWLRRRLRVKWRAMVGRSSGTGQSDSERYLKFYCLQFSFRMSQCRIRGSHLRPEARPSPPLLPHLQLQLRKTRCAGGKDLKR